MRDLHKPQEIFFFCKSFETGTVLFQLLARSLQIWAFPLGVGNNHPPHSTRDMLDRGRMELFKRKYLFTQNICKLRVEIKIRLKVSNKVESFYHFRSQIAKGYPRNLKEVAL